MTPLRCRSVMVTPPAAASHVVLVHGAWHGGWAWDTFRPFLHERGLTTDAVDLPSSGGEGSLADDAATVRTALERAPGPALVVGHSYGGMVISEACAGRDDVAHLVYLCAFQLDLGSSVLALVGGTPPAWFGYDGATGRCHVQEAAERFYGDVDTEVAARAVDRLAPQSVAAFASPLTATAWQTIPSTYVACTGDRALPHAAQLQMSRRAGSLRTLTTAHSPFLSAPDRLADILAGVGSDASEPVI